MFEEMLNEKYEDICVNIRVYNVFFPCLLISIDNLLLGRNTVHEIWW